MGAVYKALDTKNHNRSVALKELSLPQGMSPKDVKDAQRLFQAEAQILSGLYHPNIIEVAGIFQEGATWYLVMSFVPGETLSDLLNRTPGHRLPISQALAIGKQLANALHYLHTWRNPQGNVQPVIFRDLKPANVMITEGLHVVLIDFGIARLFKQGQSKDTTAYGSLGYAPPEQFGRAQTTPQSDLYSLGRLLHSLLTGDDPCDRGMQDPGRSVFDPLHPVSDHLDTLLKRMQDIQVGARPKSAKEVWNVLEYVLSHWNDPVMPAPAPAGLVSSPAPVASIGGKRTRQEAPPAGMQPKKTLATVPANPLQPKAHLIQSPASALPSHVTIFSLFTREDGKHVTDMKGGLEGALRRTTRITFLDQTLILPGANQKLYMEVSFNTADLILLFVSGAFLASDSCSEMTDRVLQRHQQGKVTVVPIVLRPCLYDYSSWSSLPMYPQDRKGKVKPITSWKDRDAATFSVVDAITQLLADLHADGRL